MNSQYGIHLGKSLLHDAALILPGLPHVAQKQVVLDAGGQLRHDDTLVTWMLEESSLIKQLLSPALLKEPTPHQDDEEDENQRVDRNQDCAPAHTLHR